MEDCVGSSNLDLQARILVLLVVPEMVDFVRQTFFYLPLEGWAAGLRLMVFLIGRGWVFRKGFLQIFEGLGATVSRVLLASGMEKRARFSMSLQCLRSIWQGTLLFLYGFFPNYRSVN